MHFPVNHSAENARKSKGFLQKKGRKYWNFIAIPILSVTVALFLMVTFAYLWLMKTRKARGNKIRFHSCFVHLWHDNMFHGEESISSFSSYD